MNNQKKLPKLLKGFLLIEILTALAILGTLVLVIMLSLAHGIQWNHEAKLRLRALNSATARVERLAQDHQPLASEKKREGCTITVRYGDASINQRKNDKIVPAESKSTEFFKTVVVTSEWESAYGEKKSIQLLTGIVINKR